MPPTVSSLNITETGIEINNKLFEFPFPLADLKLLIGEPCRIYEGAPDHDRGFSWTSKQVWDEFGISTISDKASPTLNVVEFEIQLSKKKKYEHMPSQPFLGKISITDTKIEELVIITNQYYPYPYKDLFFKDIVINTALIRTKKINEISSITIYKDKK
ncbi:hypothetical protein [Flavobacterium tegetincola]|uniref:DUF7738 domain-containing protein n=1 Tax=Flavobacterium tegetincola TaxID=150172 RepID=UPI000419652F|nr:hypothetical protein [Flavobacterium tegetincola]